MKTEEEKLKQTREKVARELRRQRNQVEQEKSRLEEMSSKVTKFKNLQELNEKHEKELKAKLNEISRELEWETITDFSPSAIEECKEQIDDTEKTFENEKVEMETKFKANLENQQEKISELDLQKARLETKKESIVKGRSQKKKELALTKRSLSELDGFSTKLEKLKRQLTE